MNTNKLAIFLAAMVLASLAADSAEAFYHSGMGRFLNRDPASTVTQHRIGQHGSSATSHGFIPRDFEGDTPGYVDGFNLYQYASSTPTNAFDAFGLQSRYSPIGAGSGFYPRPGDTAGGTAIPDGMNACIWACTGNAEEADMWNHYTDGNGAPFQIPNNDACDIVKNDPGIQKAINKLKQDCMAGKPAGNADPKPGTFRPGGPYGGGLGTATQDIKSQCQNGCLQVTVDITDTYDFNWGNRPFWAECKTRLVERFGTGTPYPVSGSCTFQVGNCQPGPALPPWKY